jgi:hypothetical protein
LSFVGSAIPATTAETTIRATTATVCSLETRPSNGPSGFAVPSSRFATVAATSAASRKTATTPGAR